MIWSVVWTSFLIQRLVKFMSCLNPNIVSFTAFVRMESCGVRQIVVNTIYLLFLSQLNQYDLSVWHTMYLMCASGCKDGKVCVHCAESAINTAQKTCDSVNKPMVGQQIMCSLISFWKQFGQWGFLWILISRFQIWPARVAVTVLSGSTRITEETVLLWTTAPVCTVEKCSAQESSSEPTAKPGTTCFGAVLPAFNLNVDVTLKVHALLQCLWPGSVALSRWTLSREMSSVWKWTLPDFWFQVVPLWWTLSVHTGRGELKTVGWIL